MKTQLMLDSHARNIEYFKNLAHDLIVMTKPGVTALLVFTAVMTYISASGPWASLQLGLVLAVAGALAAGGSGAINHYLERDLDARMPRTAGRPLVVRRSYSPNVALVWGFALCISGVLLSAIFLPVKTTFFIFLGILIYVPLYTMLLKRRSFLNVVIGGAAGCCPVLAGWAAARFDWPVLPIALASVVFFWTPAHFWAYAMCHEVDYQRAGFPMLPNIIGVRRTPPYIIAHAFFAVLASVLALRGIPLLVAGLSGIYFIACCFFLSRNPSRRSAHYVYKASNYYLMAVFCALFLV